MDIATRRRRLKFRSWHRGTREADLLLGGFADAHLDRLSDKELSAFEALLEESDPDIYDWVTGKIAVPASHRGPVFLLLARHAMGESTF